MMVNQIQNGSASVHTIADSNTWIEGKAIQQLKKTAELKGMVSVCGMPDLHPGRGYPVGATFVTRGIIYPALVGNDIGCGMTFVATDRPLRKVKLDKLSLKVGNIDGPLGADWCDFIQKQKQACGLKTSAFERCLGTIGGGNHFAEFQQIVEVYDQDEANQLSLDKDYLHLLVHSGSRGWGQHILRQHVEQFGYKGLAVDSKACQAYLDEHNAALKFAQINRACIVARLMRNLSATAIDILDINHNFIEPRQHDDGTSWLHRKGATPSDRGHVVIPGSRGDYSYLVKPKADAASLWSLAHGAGRKWMRGECKQRLVKRYKKSDLERTRHGSRVICKDSDLLFEEAPEAYKSIDSIIKVMEAADLLRLVARLKPVLTYKTRGSC